MKFWLWICLLCVSNLFAQGPVRSIVIFGNEKTDRKTILDIALIPPKALVDQVMLKEVDDRLVNSGLFKSVAVRAVNNSDGTSDIRIALREKQLWFAFPIVQAWSGRYSFGAAFGESNLLFPSTRTIVGGQWGNKLSRVFVGTDSKNMMDSGISNRAFAYGRWDHVPLYVNQQVADEIYIREGGFGVTPGYQWTNEIRTSLGFDYRHYWYGESTLVAESGLSGHDVSMNFEFLYDSLRRRDGFVVGDMIQFSYVFAQPQFGTDFSYHIERAHWTHAQFFLKYLNYIGTIQGGIGDRLPFHQQFTMGGNSLRGYSDRQLRGDTMISLKQDLLFRIYKHPRFSVFGDTFHDFGFVYLDAQGPSTGSVRNGVGAGLRVSLADIVAPVFGFDMGYGIEQGSLQFLLALGLVSF